MFHGLFLNCFLHIREFPNIFKGEFSLIRIFVKDLCMLGGVFHPCQQNYDFEVRCGPIFSVEACFCCLSVRDSKIFRKGLVISLFCLCQESQQSNFLRKLAFYPVHDCLFEIFKVMGACIEIDKFCFQMPGQFIM